MFIALVTYYGSVERYTLGTPDEGLVWLVRQYMRFEGCEKGSLGGRA